MNIPDKRKICHIHIIIILFINLSLSGGFCFADENSEFLVLTNIGVNYDVDSSLTSEENNPAEVGLDLFYVYNWQESRIFLEVFLASDEFELERLQFDYAINKQFKLIFGRIHSPTGYWNTRLHHGVYFQTSISRPQIVAYEDDGGILPVHISGLGFSSALNSVSSGWQFDFIYGATPDLFENDNAMELRPFDIINPDSGSYDPALVMKLSYLANSTLQADSGLSMHIQKMDAKAAGLTHIRQNIVNVYSYVDIIDKRLIFSAYYIHSSLKSATDSEMKDKFVSAYFQYEQDFNQNWIVYSRIERGRGIKNDAYVSLFNNFVEEQTIFGFRFDLTSNQAIKIEYQNKLISEKNKSFVVVEWSGVFP